MNYHMIQLFHFWVSKENENTDSKRYLHPHVYCIIIYKSQEMKAT